MTHGCFCYCLCSFCYESSPELYIVKYIEGQGFIGLTKQLAFRYIHFSVRKIFIIKLLRSLLSIIRIPYKKLYSKSNTGHSHISASSTSIYQTCYLFLPWILNSACCSCAVFHPKLCSGMGDFGKMTAMLGLLETERVPV